ncbi:MAG: sigma-70 family RNA polymerase sigma factor [Myxococcaceae bacterium]
MALGEDRKVVLEKYGPYVRSLAAQVRKQFNAQLELDELMSYGQIGLLEAADRFDSKVGANFLTFAHYRIKGAIYDGLRKMGVLRGSDQRSSYASERSSAYLTNLSDREMGGSNRGGSFADDVKDISDAVEGLAVIFAASMDGADQLGMGEGGATIPADERLELEQQKTRIRAAIATLPDNERKLLEGYYFHGKTLEEAGAAIGQSKSWASRLHARAVERLKEMLSEDEEPKLDSRRKAHGGTPGGSHNLSGANRAAKDAGPLSQPAEAGRK